MHARHTILLSAALVSLGAGGTLPALGVVINGVDWGNTYYDPGTGTGKHGTPTTATPAWTIGSLFGNESAVAVVDDFLRLTTDNVDTTATPPSSGTYTFRQTNGLGSSFENVTVEFTVRVTEVLGTHYAGSFLMLDSVGPKFFDMPLGLNGGVVTGTNITGKSFVADLSDFRTFRVTLAPAASDATKSQFDVYLQDADKSGWSNVYSAEISRRGVSYIQFGDGSTSASLSGVTDWESVRWTTQGAFNPIPEPTAVGLLGLGGGLLLGRRVRRA